eukprot:TRINITY_DN31560_c0_g1_i1.p1 TRINITY_DN31560_c0_g1~~TRINITY_DN31560_c0_g1_i1.p1  ORF type:complete len:786 (-),score=165.54 TRINITY_DN31560_c0_g1_i1:209-2566(-)
MDPQGGLKVVEVRGSENGDAPLISSNGGDMQAVVLGNRSPDHDHEASEDGSEVAQSDQQSKGSKERHSSKAADGRQVSCVTSEKSGDRDPKSQVRDSAQASHVREVHRMHMKSLRRRQSEGPLKNEVAEEPAEDKKSQKEGTFVDAAAMKERVRQKLSKHKYDVSDFYKADGVWQAVARDGNFDKVTLLVITFNALWIAIDTDLNHAPVLIEAHPIFQMAENLFCAFFSFEWFVRSMSFRRIRDGFKDTWFVFDMTMVVLMVAETWVFSIFLLFVSSGGGGSSFGILRVARLMRLSRMCRMARLIRAMPELFVMLKGLFAATRSVFFTLVLLIGLLFVFAIAFKQLSRDSPLKEDLFASIPGSMYHLLVHGTLLLNADSVANRIRLFGGPAHAALFFFFILLAAVLLMNMLIGVLCEVVSAVAVTEKEEMLVTFVHEKLTAVMALIDEDGGGTISRNEFMQILDNEGAIESLQDVGVDVIGLVDYADFIFGGDEEDNEDGEEIELTLPQFMEVILQLRGSNSATVKDVVDIRKFVRTMIQQTTKRLDVIEDKHDTVQKRMSENLGMLAEIKQFIIADDRPSKDAVQDSGPASNGINFDPFFPQDAGSVLTAKVGEAAIGDVDLDPVVMPLFKKHAAAPVNAVGMNSYPGQGVSLPMPPSTPESHRSLQPAGKPGFTIAANGDHAAGDNDIDTRFRQSLPTTTTAPLPGRLVDVVPRTQVVAFGPKGASVGGDATPNGAAKAFFGIAPTAAAAATSEDLSVTWNGAEDTPGWKSSNHSNMANRVYL